mmetsp:Transcript_41915/g.76637  ORF Transcript_41915/g.76637 Transcript_41915/m.76637 type:complete len:528 (+) Transcript_41915:65-1648(+)
MSPDKNGHMTQSMASYIKTDVSEFSDNFDNSAPPVGLDMAGHDTYLMGPKTVMLDSFVVDLLNVDTSAQTFRLKLLLNMDWEDDGTIEPETKAKRNLGRINTFTSEDSTRATTNGSFRSGKSNDSYSSAYKTGKYVPKREFREDSLASTWNPEVVLVNAIADENPIEAGSKLHCVNMLSGRPVISRSVLYQPECRCEFTFSNFPFDETDLVVKFSSNKWNSEQVNFMWSNRLDKEGSGRRTSNLGGLMPLRRESSYLKKSVDKSAIGGVGLSEFEIIKVRVETEEKDVNSMQRYDNAEGAFSEAHLIMRVRRDPYSYLLRVASIAELLMLLEVLSFLSDNDDLSERFSISGTIFLAMVSLYGPMADALPKVSVVTRVDKWHLHNFFLLFASNVENLMAFMLRSIINETVLTNVESLLGILYLYFVIKNLIWFIKPLQDREEYTLLLVWLEDRSELYKEKLEWVVGKVLPWRKKPKKEEEEGSPTNKKWGTAVGAVVRMKNGITKKNSNEQPQERPRGVAFSDGQKRE